MNGSKKLNYRKNIITRRNILLSGLAFSFPFLLLGGCGFSRNEKQNEITRADKKGIRLEFITLKPTLVPKPADDVEKRLAIKQPTVPENFTEMPFVEHAPSPRLTGDEKKCGYMLFHRPIIEPIHPNTRPRKTERLKKLAAFAARGEFETLTFSVYPLRDLKNFRVRVSDLKSSSGELNASNMDIRLLTYWNIRFPRYSSPSTYRRLPELLEKVSAHSSPAFESQRWCVTAHVPENTAPGVYTGRVTLWDDLDQQATSIPIKLRVLDFKLLSDPNKHYSAFCHLRNKLQYAGKSKSEIRRMLDNEYQAMRELGINTFPTMRLGWDAKKRELYLRYAEEIDVMRKYGFKGPLPVTAMSIVSQLYRETTPDGKIGNHWAITKMPPPEFYKRIEEAVKHFIKKNKGKNWPELYCKPIDEVSAKSKEFGAKVFKAFKSAGMKTFTTKNPAAKDAKPYVPYINAWCSQPYSIPYEKIIKQPTAEYWCYPNHNGTEKRDSLTMCKGGRMTYGFGFWRSGYSLLIPWNWSWGGHWNPKLARQFDYLRSANSGSGQRIDKNGEVIFAINWVCFREGVDDARYIYTLQQAIWSRTGSKDPKCRALVVDAKNMLRKMWNDITPQKKYLRSGMWASEEFDARRWRLAVHINKLLKYPIVRKGQAPSVIINTESKSNERGESIMLRETLKGNLERKDLSASFDKWKSLDTEGKITLVKSAGVNGKVGIRWTVRVDHHKGKANYPIGWPKIRCKYTPPLDFTKYDYLKYRIRVDSDRDEVADDVTPLGFTVKSNKFFEVVKDLGGRQHVWIPVVFNIHDEIKALCKGTDPWREIPMLQLFIAEKNYKDKTEITFDIASAELLRFKTPVLSKLACSSIVLLPKNKLQIAFELMGRLKGAGKYDITCELKTKNGSVIQTATTKLSPTKNITLNIKRVKPGKFTLVLSLSRDGRVLNKLSKDVDFLAGPFY